MLSNLQITDYALIENINIEFKRGLNIITGETGAGKSILIDALGLLLGERASTDIIRKGSKKAIVEGIFNVQSNKKIESLLVDNDIDIEPELIVRREVSLKGSNRCFLNDIPVKLNLIKEAGDLLVDLHGQHEHQSLLRSETHIEVLDEFGGYSELLSEFTHKKNTLISLLSNLRDLQNKVAQLRKKRDLFLFQIKEIDTVNPEAGEDDKLEHELIILENSEQLLEKTTNAFNLLYEGDNPIYDNFGDVQNILVELKKIDNSFAEKCEEADSIMAMLNDIVEFIRDYRDRIDLEPDRLEEMRRRLNAINSLKKKFGGSLNSVLDYREKIGGEVDLADNFSDKINSLKSEIDAARIETGKAAVDLSKQRRITAGKIEKEIVEILSNLGIADAVFKVSFENERVTESTQNYLVIEEKKYKFNSNGYDVVEFLISTNLGESPKQLAKIASGGEISRVMLALKSLLAKNDKLPLLIFDEIDTGVSGRIAQMVGQAIKGLSKFHQLIAITHLPQIASLADHHYGVEKRKIGERIVSTIRELIDDERIEEIAKLLSGEKVTEAGMESAKELINSKN